MVLNRSNQQLRRELKEIARQGDEAVQAIWMVAKTLPDEQAAELMAAATIIYDCVDKANALADRVKSGEVVAT